MSEIILATQQALSANSAILVMQIIGGGFVAAGIYFLVSLWSNQ